MFSHSDALYLDCDASLYLPSLVSVSAPWPKCMCVCSVTQSCPTPCNPMDCSPPGSSVHGIFPGKKTGVGCHFPLWGIFLTQELNLSLLCLCIGRHSLPPCHLGTHGKNDPSKNTVPSLSIQITILQCLLNSNSTPSPNFLPQHIWLFNKLCNKHKRLFNHLSRHLFTQHIFPVYLLHVTNYSRHSGCMFVRV